MSLSSRLRYIKDRLVYELTGRKGGSVEIRSRKTIDAFVEDPDHPFLVSFPRTGSHWLRMMMELYFETPSLLLVFYYPEKKDYLTLGTHDLDLSVERTSVIYLYRNPVPTVFSQLKYHLEDPADPERIRHWSDLYGRHLDKWLFQESFTTRKTVLRYERLKADLHSEFARVCAHLDRPFLPERLDEVARQATKQNVKDKTGFDTKVINRDARYDEARKRFADESGALVWQTLLDHRPHLREAFDAEEIPV